MLFNGYYKEKYMISYFIQVLKYFLPTILNPQVPQVPKPVTEHNCEPAEVVRTSHHL